MSDSAEGELPELLGPGTWTRQGPATLLLRGGAWVVFVPGERKTVIEAAWAVLEEEPAPEEFVDRLVEAGELESAEKFKALLFGFHDGTRAVFGVKGATPIAVYTAEGSEQIVGTDDGPFVLRTLEGVRRTAFGDLPAEEGLGAPRLVSGVVPVRGFVHVTMDPAELEQSERAALAEQVEKDGRSIEDPEVKKRRAARPAPKPVPAASTPPPTRPSPSTRPSTSTSAPAPRSEAAAAESAPNMFDGLFGAGKPGPTTSTTPPPSGAAASPAGQDAAAPQPAPSPPASATSAPAPSAPEPAATTSTTAPEVAPSAPSASATEQTAADGPTPAPQERTAQEGAAGTPGAGGPAKRRLVSSSLFDRPRRTGSAASAPAAPAVPAAPAPSSATPPGSIPTPDSPQDEEAPGSAHTDELLTPDTQIAPIDDGDEGEPEPAPAARRARAPRPAGSSDSGGDLENTGAYDDLFGKTVFRSIEDAAVRRTEEDEEPEAATEAAPAPESTSAAPGPGAPEGQEEEAAPATAPAPSQSAAPSEFIDWVPGVGRTAPEIAQTAARRAAAPRPPEQPYPQVHMAERPPAPNTGSRPAPTTAPPGAGLPASLQPSAQPPAPYEQFGAAAAYGGPVNTSAAGQQVGYPSRQGRPPYPMQAPSHQGAAGHQVGLPSPPPPPRGQGRPAPGWGSPSQPAAAPQGPSAPRGAPQPPSGPSAGSVAQPSGAAVMLPGLVCPQGHPNSPERGACRFCGAPLQGPTRTVARPPLGAVLISTGGRFVLDRTAIVGRRPRASRVSADDVPQLITVPSPQQDISRSHLELRLEGWHVVALDLGTTNGTTLHREGFESLRLRPREGVVLHHGDHLDLGDDVHLRFGERA